MTPRQAALEFDPELNPQADRDSCRSAGASLAEALHSSTTAVRAPARISGRGIALRILQRVAGSSRPGLACVLDNLRLVRAADTAASELAARTSRLPMVIDDGRPILRVVKIAGAYLDHTNGRFAEGTSIAFLRGFLQIAALTMEEIAAFQQALQTELVQRLEYTESDQWPAIFASLAEVTETPWQDLFEAVSAVDRILERDPVGAYSRMDAESRSCYRQAIVRMCQSSSHTECEVAQMALALAEEAYARAGSGESWRRRTHVGYYLVDRGSELLQRQIGAVPRLGDRVSRAFVKWPARFYFAGLAMITLAVIAIILKITGTSFASVVVLSFLPIAASQPAVEVLNGLIRLLLPLPLLPKLDFSGGIPEDCAALVAVSATLLNKQQVHELVRNLEIRFLANRDPNLAFALLTDLPDAVNRVDDREQLVDFCAELIEDLNRRYRESPFLMLHGNRACSDSKAYPAGWERSGGKLIELNRLLGGGHDAFPVKAGRVSRLHHVRYVIALGSDTKLPREAAAKLVGAIAHPLNAGAVDPATQTVLEGYGILQPRISVSFQSAARSRLAAFYFGQSGFETYTCAISEVYQDLFGETVFAGKGIYDVNVFNAVLERRFPKGAQLSQGPLEAFHARTGFVSDIELIDECSPNFSGYQDRKYQSVRADWQLLQRVLNGVPDDNNRAASNRVSAILRWKIADNLRRRLLAPSVLALFLFAWFTSPVSAWLWGLIASAMLLLPVYGDLLLSVLRVPKSRIERSLWAKRHLRALAGHARALLQLMFLVPQSLQSLDAMVRSVVTTSRMMRGLPDRESAVESENAWGAPVPVNLYLRWTPLISAAIGIVLVCLRPSAFPAAIPILILWLISPGVAAWLDRQPSAAHGRLGIEDAQWLRLKAQQICRYFLDWSSPATHWAIPNSVGADGPAEMRLSPTNLGMLLNARIAAVHLDASTLEEFVYQTRQTLALLLKFPKHRGHLLSLYNLASLEPMPPQFISTVESGNLAASLWTLKQAALAFADQSLEKRRDTANLSAGLHEIASISDRLVREMDFSILYNERSRAFSIRYDPAHERQEPACHNLEGSAARLALFVAVAKGDISPRAWHQLGREQAGFGCDGIPGAGAMLEHFLPWLWMCHYPGTMAERRARAAASAKQRYVAEMGALWGISESVHREPDGKAAHGPFEKLAITPYAALLAAQVHPVDLVRNLRRMEQLGWSGRYGFYEAAADHTRPRRQVIRFWMARHQGMLLLAICNVLFDNLIQRYFNSEPQVAATELLLHEPPAPANLTEPELLVVSQALEVPEQAQSFWRTHTAPKPHHTDREQPGAGSCL